MRRILIALCASALLAALASPAAAITRGGEPDGENHPYVGIMVANMEDGTPIWRCSGALISPLVFVTAGHCTEAPAARATIWFETTLEPDPAAFGWPFGGATSVDGTVHTHPLYDPNAFYLYDLGLVVLDEPVKLDEYAQLPSVDQVDDLGKGRKSAAVTAVGYGLQAMSINPVIDMVQADLTRYQATLFVVDTKGVAGIGNLPDSHSMILSGDAKHGGTCFGDSGGPILDGTTILAVTSFGLNFNCAGVGGAFRIDRTIELAWITSFPD
jgi:hypothetical protein